MPAYRFDETYEWNYQNGPEIQIPFPILDEEPSYSLLGFPLNSPVGISAGILLNSNWIETYAKFGFDILTYKTVRSGHRPCYPLPNWVFLDCDAPLDESGDEPLTAHLAPNRSLERLTSSVCFGMPSMAPEIWQADIEKAKKSLRKGQILIVSVVGTPCGNTGLDELANDYADCARWACEAGADMIEANLSCPNVCTAEGQIYHDETGTKTIVERIRGALPDHVPLLLKIGILSDKESYKKFIRWIAPAAQGIVLVNCLSRRILAPDGSPVFGKDKERAGVLGWATHGVCLDHTKTLLQARDETAKDLAVLSVGGVVSVTQALDYHNVGSDAVLLGGAPVFDPMMAVKIKETIRKGFS